MNGSDVLVAAREAAIAFADPSVVKAGSVVDKAVSKVAHALVAALGDKPDAPTVKALRDAFVGPARFTEGKETMGFGAYVMARSTMKGEHALFAVEKSSGKDGVEKITHRLTVTGEEARKRAQELVSKTLRQCGWTTRSPGAGRPKVVYVCPCCEAKLNLIEDASTKKKALAEIEQA
jgi:hypothetical protein